MAGPSSSKVPLNERNNFEQGRTGGKAPRLPGVKPKADINPTKSGGIFRPLKSN
jgi:hypothetical protein